MGISGMGMSNECEENPTGFRTTQWSLVHRAGGASSVTRRASMETLLQRYLPALRAHLIIAKKLPAELANDLLQGFIADKMLEQNLAALAHPSKGKFRSFLVVALNRYVIDQLRRANSAKRGAATSCDLLLAELASGEAQPSEQFDLVWARELVARALQLMQEECRSTGRGEIWSIFDCRIVQPAFHGIQAMSYNELVTKFQLQAPLQAYNLLTTGKRMFARCLREAAADYVAGPEMIDEEITDLKSVLARFGA
jgi:DNA-directed RNA polymerase specialized sigma24 family protein